LVAVVIHKRFHRYKLDFIPTLPSEETIFYLSSIVGGHALTPPTRHSLGGLLPHQLADRT